MTTYNATAYGDSHPDPAYHLDRVPETWALRIDIGHPTSGSTVLIYDKMPPEDERRELMWQLQNAAGKTGGTVTVIEEDGTRLDAPAIG